MLITETEMQKKDKNGEGKARKGGLELHRGKSQSLGHSLVSKYDICINLNHQTQHKIRGPELLQ